MRKNWPRAFKQSSAGRSELGLGVVDGVGGAALGVARFGFDLCAAEGWELHPNVSDVELDELYATAHYALAPFAYGEGSKLKLMEACGRGVPILTTRAGMTGLATRPPCIQVSDEWKEWKRIVQSGPPPAQALRETLDFAEQLSWSRLGAKLVRLVEDSAVVEIS